MRFKFRLTMSTNLNRFLGRARLTFQRSFLTNSSTRHFGTQHPRPSLPSRQPVIETFSETSRPRPYYANHPPSRELPRLKVLLSQFSDLTLISDLLEMCSIVKVAFRSWSSHCWRFCMGSVYYLCEE